jgi:hypothetical protein
MAVGVIIYATAVILHIAVKHTYFDPASPIGVLISERYVTVGWWVLALSTLQLLIPALVYSVWIDRWLKKSGWIVFWVVLVGLLVVLQLLIVIYLGNNRTNCNGQGEAGNLCNALLWCCVPDIFMNVANECPPGPCGVATPPVVIPATIADLAPDGMFLALLWFNVSFLIISTVILLILLASLITAPEYSVLSKVRRKKTSSIPDLDEDEEVESEMRMNTGETVITRRRKSPQSNGGVLPVALEVPVTHLITRNMSNVKFE